MSNRAVVNNITNVSAVQLILSSSVNLFDWYVNMHNLTPLSSEICIAELILM
jgi:hypothetical protein